MSYYDDTAVNWSTLKHMADSPAAYKHAVNTPRPDTPALVLGRLVHCLVLEPQSFDLQFAIWDGDRRGNEWKAFRDECDGLTIVKRDEHEWANAVAQSVLRSPVAAQFLAGGIVERPLYWTDQATGIKCKARPDLVREEDRILIDLKTTRSVQGRRFGAEAARYRYPQQLAHYHAGVAAALGWAPERHLLIAVDKAPPHEVGVFEIDMVSRQLAAQEVEELLSKLRACIDADEWPGMHTEVQALQLPAWVYDDDEADADGYGLSFGGE